MPPTKDATASLGASSVRRPSGPAHMTSAMAPRGLRSQTPVTMRWPGPKPAPAMVPSRRIKDARSNVCSILLVAMTKEPLFELRRRTFDTPHFAGIEFIEVEAKSIINHVPGNRFPFSYTINPYRGCSHACSYTEVGETPILMADGR